MKVHWNETFGNSFSRKPTYRMWALGEVHSGVFNLKGKSRYEKEAVEILYDKDYVLAYFNNLIEKMYPITKTELMIIINEIYQGKE